MGKLIQALLALVGLCAIVLVGGYFFLKRGDLPYDALATRYGNAASQYVDLPSGVHMHYRDEGNASGPTLVLVHGFSASLHTWEPWVQRLGNEYHVVSLDLPGHGLTRAPAGYKATIENLRDSVAEFVRARGLTHFALAGNSMGGNVAWEYALAHPDQLDALILVDAGGWPSNGMSDVNPTFFALLRNPITGPILRDLDNTAIFKKGVARAFADPALATDAMVTRYVDLARAPGHRDILMQIQLGSASRNFATPERLAAIHTPTLIMFGTEDHLIPTENGEKFHQAIPGSELLTLDHCGHLPQEEQSDRSANAVRAFLHAHAAATPAAAVH